ncbi:hypothetical protein [Novosphingobium sp.]|uniref:hypothetical protein n=1 Tax=Novosphingobium sp. TaxID=1874826 RepID=UPI0025F2159C|nr:hypothetical protein [Novosphingobium sp.]MCC6927192.1 hypothetical protein [Novosphingobium sp.]
MKARIVLLAGAAAMLPVLLPGSFAQAVEPPTAEQFVPPRENLILSRTVIRELSDGNLIKVTRRYAVQFKPESGGYRLDGKLVNVVVEVPPVLNGLADIERRRDDSSMFPVFLDQRGAILVDAEGKPIDRQAHDQMASRASVLLAQSGMKPESLQMGTRVIGQAMTARAGSPWPTDLFLVRPGEHRQSRMVTLPGGAQGQIEVVTRVDRLLPCGLPQTIERTVVTLLSGSKRISREIWTFEPASA